MIRAVLLDLDGTLYWGDRAVAGAPEFVQFLDAHQVECLFVTNRSNRTPERICKSLEGMGIPCSRDRILTSSQATALHLRQGSAYCVGEEGLTTALAEAGIRVTDQDPDWVVIGFDRNFTYEKLAVACRLIDRGARFIATNPDQGLRTEEGIVPGTGSIVAAVAAGCGREPLMIGKPEPRIFELALERLGCSAGDAICVGDNVTTDIPAGHAAGIRTALMLTGISTRADLEHAAVQPTWICEDFGELTHLLDSFLTPRLRRGKPET